MFLGLATVRMQNAHARNRRSSLMNVFKNGKENMGPPTPSYPLTNSVSSIAPSSATDRISLASDTNGGATSTPGDSSGEGISDLEMGNLPSDAPIPSTTEKSKQKKKNSHRRLGSFGVRPNDDGKFFVENLGTTC